MPAVGYDYSYSRNNNSNQGLANSAKSRVASNKMSAQKKVTSHHVAQKNVQRTKTVKQNHANIDVPVVVKKKVELPKVEELKLTKPKDLVKAKKKTENAKKSIIATVLGFGLLFIICMRYAQINELTHQLNSLEKELTGVESLNEQLSVEVDSKTDLSYIEKYAKYQLGMQKPDEKQIVRIAYDKQDKISTPIVIEDDAEPNFWEKLWNDLQKIID